jgi:GNAT superfamily N-acetyltransferase
MKPVADSGAAGSGAPTAPSGALTVLREYLRSRGVWATLRRLFTAFVYRREHLVLYYKSMEDEIQPVTAKIPGVSRRATLDDLDGLQVFAHHYTRVQFQRWIERGWVSVFEHDAKLIAYRVVTRELPRVGAPHDLLKLAPTDVWAVNMYTLPEYQGLRVQAALITYVLAENRALGYRREISMGRLDNESSRRTIGLSGGREMQEVLRTRLLGFTRYRFVETGARHYYGGHVSPGGRDGANPADRGSGSPRV